MVSPIEVIKYSKKISVLYVEDDLVLRDATQKLFENYFTHIDVAGDGAEGLDKYSNSFNNDNKYDLIITDINMPKMNGIDMCKEIFKINPSQRIIITSAHSKHIDIVKEMGIKATLAKPLDSVELSESIYKISKEIYDEKEASQNNF